MEMLKQFGPQMQEIVLKEFQLLNFNGQIKEIENQNQTIEITKDTSFLKILEEMIENFVDSIKNIANNFYSMIFPSTEKSTEKKEKKDSNNSLSVNQATLLSVFVVVSYLGLSALVTSIPNVRNGIETAFAKVSSKLLN